MSSSASRTRVAGRPQRPPWPCSPGASRRRPTPSSATSSPASPPKSRQLARELPVARRDSSALPRDDAITVLRVNTTERGATMSHTNTIDPEDIYTMSAAARLLRVSPSTLRALERRGNIACTWTPGRQRRFAGSELLRLLAQSQGPAPAKPAQTSSAATTDTAEATVRRAWLGPLIARAQRELPADTPAAIRLQLGTDLERALSNWGPTSPVSDVAPLITSVVEQAQRQVQTAHEDTERRHIQATLRDQLRDLLQKRLRGDEDEDHVQNLAEDFLAAWIVEQGPDSRLPNTLKLLVVGATGLVGGATAAAACSSEIRARAKKLKGPLLSLAGELLNRLSPPPPPPSPSPPPPPPPAADRTATRPLP